MGSRRYLGGPFSRKTTIGTIRRYVSFCSPQEGVFQVRVFCDVGKIISLRGRGLRGKGGMAIGVH